MILNVVTALQLILLVVSSAIMLYALLIKRDDSKTNCFAFLINLCLLWMVLI